MTLVNILTIECKPYARFFDVIFSLIAVILLLPLLFPIALVLRITGEGEVFFQQSRIGKNGRPFNLIKLQQC